MLERCNHLRFIATDVGPQNPHYELDESSRSRQEREDLLRKLYAYGVDMTKSLNMKIKAGPHDVNGEVRVFTCKESGMKSSQ